MEEFRLGEDGLWACVIPMRFDPFGKLRAMVSVEVEEEPPARLLREFLSELGRRYEGIWEESKDSLLSQGWSLRELRGAHRETIVHIEDWEGSLPGEWGIEYDFVFNNGYTIGYTLDFSGWSTDNHWSGCH